MKKLFILIVLATITTTSGACDICGCGSGGSFMGMIPQFGYDQFGIRSGYRIFHHPMTELNMNGQSRVIKDENWSFDFNYRKFTDRRFQFAFVLPYKVNTRTETLRTTQIKGIGDLQGSVLYTFLNTSDSMEVRFKQILTAGIGVKLPTGKYMQRDDSKTMLPALFQIGTGSTDFIAQVYYVIRYRNWGVNAIGQYTLRGENELTYAFGDFVQTTASIFYKKDFVREVKTRGSAAYVSGETRVISVLPTIGYSMENAQVDYQYDLEKENTGGTQYLLHGGLDVYFSKWSLSLFYQHAVFNDIPVAQPENKDRFGLGVSFKV
jgi:hypothetical protein